MLNINKDFFGDNAQDRGSRIVECAEKKLTVSPVLFRGADAAKAGKIRRR